jgi:diguanylate cyclase (GGDEF)-like protein
MIDQPQTLLLIDDNATNLGVLTGYLKGQGFQLMVARNGKDGLERARLGHPDLILLDVMMPDMDGFETCRRLKADPATQEIGVIFITALQSVEDKVKGFAAGGVDYISKPLQAEEVLARVSTHLKLQAQKHLLQEQNRLLELEITERKRIEAELERLATTDPLTGLYNRRHFFTVAEAEFKKAQRYERLLSAIMLDIDHFKKINDTYGHAVGDQALIFLAQHLRACMRAVDVVARYGGEEFVILLPETPAETAYQQVAERIRVQLEQAVMPLPEGGDLKFTVSLGIADNARPAPDATFEHLLKMADEALYVAKDSGRNQSVVFPSH